MTGFCTQRYFMLTICLLQLVTIIQRQVFDFLGFLWVPILVNFFEIIFLILGFFGAFQYRPKYIILYSIWHLFWLGWNIFLICLYLDVGILNHKESKVLKLDPDSDTWWINGPGCKGTLNTTASAPVWENVTNCLVDYRYVEIFQAGLQCFLTFFGLVTGFCTSRALMEEDDTFNYLNGDAIDPRHYDIKPMYQTSSNNSLNLSQNTSSFNAFDSVLPMHKFNTAKYNKYKNSKVVHSDLIRLHNFNKSQSYEYLDSVNRPNYKRPKSLYAKSTDY